MPASSLEAVDGKKYKTHNPAFVLCCVYSRCGIHTLSSLGYRSGHVVTEVHMKNQASFVRKHSVCLQVCWCLLIRGFMAPPGANHE